MFKRKMIAPLVAILLCVGMVSVGFAAWVITSTDDKVIDDGSFTVYAVEQNVIILDQENTKFTDATINFGAGARQNAQATDWLTFSDPTDGSTPEDLQAEFQVVISNWNDVKAKNVQLTLSDFAVTGAGSGWDNAYDGKALINLPTDMIIKITPNSSTNPTAWTVTLNDQATTEINVNNGTVTIPINFSWGAYFGTSSTNPVNYFNGLANNETNRDAADGVLKELKLLENAKYTFNLVATVAA